MTETKIRKRLADFCKTGDLKKVKAIYTMLEDEIIDANGWDEDFVKEMDSRNESFLNGTAKTYTWEETKTAAIKSVKANKKHGPSLKNS